MSWLKLAGLQHIFSELWFFFLLMGTFWNTMRQLPCKVTWISFELLYSLRSGLAAKLPPAQQPVIRLHSCWLLVQSLHQPHSFCPPGTSPASTSFSDSYLLVITGQVWRSGVGRGEEERGGLLHWRPCPLGSPGGLASLCFLAGGGGRLYQRWSKGLAWEQQGREHPPLASVPECVVMWLRWVLKPFANPPAN